MNILSPPFGPNLPLYEADLAVQITSWEATRLDLFPRNPSILPHVSVT